VSEYGKYVVIEGNDGTGKSTQVGLMRERLAAHGIESVEFHEPAGTPIADEIRTILKNGELERDGETDLLLFTAARHEIWKTAHAKLKLGIWVVAARNYYSSLAYQGYGKGVPVNLITETTRQFTDEQYMNPDLALILAVDDQTREERIANRGSLEKPDAFESLGDDFQARLNSGYLRVAETHGLTIIDASQSPEDVSNDIWLHVEPLID
jgi:dTMP kinase